MSTKKRWTVRKRWTPADVGTDETTPLFQVHAGYRVPSLSGRVTVPADAGSNIAMTVGDGTDVDGFITSFDPETAVNLDGNGAFMANSGGKLYTGDDTIDVVYDQTTYAGVAPVIWFTATIEREYP